MKNQKKRFKKMYIIIPVLLAIIIWIAWANKALELNTITITSEKLPKAFDGYRIAHVSDLHNTDGFGKNNKKLIELLKKSHPDIIAITGDMLDSRRPGYEHNLNFAKEAVKIAPCYFVPGNHESKSNEYKELKVKLKKTGVTVIEDSTLELTYNQEKITLHGICDPLFKTAALTGDSVSVTQKRLELRTKQKGEYNILLSHRPELFDLYTEYGFDLVLSGHAHGGQFRLPFIGGILAPNQGLFPKYDSGLYTKNNTNMIVSRGIGRSVIPFRINNNPEIIIVELKTK